MIKRQAQLDFILKDMRSYHGQSSWDWEADLRFARFLGDKEAEVIINDACHCSLVPMAVALMHTKAALRVKGKRLDLLRELVREGLVEKWPLGTGQCGRTDCGISWAMSYHLKEEA